MKKKQMVWLVLAAFVALPVFAGGDEEKASGEAKGSDEVKVMRVSHTLAPESHYHQGLLKLDELLKEKSGGRLQLQVHHSAQLGSERDVVEGVSLGTIEMTLTSSAPLANFTDGFLVFNLPFIIRDREAAYKWMDGPEGMKILKSLESAGIKGLGIWENGFRNLTNSAKAVSTPADLGGLKIRLMENPIHVATFETMGARAVPMPFGELFTALQQKTVDGQENPLVIIETSKFYEVQNYLTLTGHFYAPAILLINKDYWDNKLTAEDRKIFIEAEKEAKQWERDYSKKSEKELRAKLEGKGMTVIDVDKKDWASAVSSVYDKFAGKIGQDRIDSIVRAQN